MSSDFDFSVDECERWIQKLAKMSVTLGKKGDGDGAKMFATAAVLIEQMGVQLQRERISADYPNSFGLPLIADA